MLTVLRSFLALDDDEVDVEAESEAAVWVAGCDSCTGVVVIVDDEEDVEAGSEAAVWVAGCDSCTGVVVIVVSIASSDELPYSDITWVSFSEHS